MMLFTKLCRHDQHDQWVTEEATLGTCAIAYVPSQKKYLPTTTVNATSVKG